MVAARVQFLLLGLTSVVLALNVAQRNPDANLRTTGFLEKYGYASETHHVVTEDGYVLELHRVIGDVGGDRCTGSGKRVVLLQHGLAGSSADWVIAGPGKSLAYLLSDRGYDVWLGNSRGNVYSRNHTILSPNDRSFWDFSWHEMGIYDLPAAIDYILAQTGSRKIFYVGHSQGSTQFFVMASERPQYNAKIILMTAFAPAAYTANLRGPVTKLATLTHFGVWVGENFGYPEIAPRSTWGKFVSSFMCRDSSLTQLFCGTLMFAITGYNKTEKNSTDLSLIVEHVPAGGSWKQFIHYGQGTTEQGRFRKFDYENDEKNLRLYNADLPPEYDLEKITAPVALLSSENDWLAGPKDVALLETRLRSLVLSYKIPMHNTFNHYDFLWGTHAPELVYERLFKLLQEYSQ